MRKLLLLFLFIIIYSCKHTSSENSYTYFGGQIINPEIDLVYLIKDGKVLDSTYLDIDNKFLMKFKLEHEGLLLFKHGNEFQNLYLVPNDSVLVRLNTWDFDESIVFSGKGAEKNNFLINLFLINELEDLKFYPFYQFDTKIFSKKIDSTLKSKEKLLAQFKKLNKDITNGFLNIAKTGITLSTLRKKENYAYGYKKIHNLHNSPIITNDFYNYRNQINLNDTTLIYYHPYQNYLNSLIYNKAFLIKEKDTLNQSFTQITLNLIVDEFKNPKIKNTLLKQTLLESFLNKHNCYFDKDELDFYFKNSTDQVDINTVKNLLSDSKSISEGDFLNDFILLDSKNQVYNIKSLLSNQKAVIYFWSPNTLSTEYLLARLDFLETHFPTILFIGINTDTSPLSVEKTISSKLNNQYFLPDNSQGKAHVSSSFPRTIIINHNGQILSNFTFLASKHFNNQLLELEKAQ